MISILCVLLALSGFQDPEKARATHQNYKDAIDVYKNFSSKVFTEEYWNEIEVTNKKTREIKNFKDFAPLHKSTFVFVLAQQLSQEAVKLQKAWEEEVKKFDQKEYSSENPNIAKKEDVKKYAEELLSVRKKFTSQFTSFADKMLMEFKNEITEDEKKMIRRKLKEFNQVEGKKD